MQLLSFRLPSPKRRINGYRFAEYLLAFVLVLVLGMAASAVWAVPTIPLSDDEVLETLPYRLFTSDKRRALPLRPQARPQALPQAATGQATQQLDPATAAQQARQYLEQARERGDPRYAGYALAVLKPWRDQVDAPAAIILLLATLDQYQHDFDRARQRLTRLLKTVPANSPVAAQAWLTLATIERVQGRYADSDRACAGLMRLAAIHAQACMAENAALRGQHDAARRQINELLGLAALQIDNQVDTRRWLLTTQAELEERAGRPVQAEKAYRQALALMDQEQQDSYLVLAYADFLLSQNRAKDVMRLLARQPEPISDAVLLRRAIAEKALGAPVSNNSSGPLAERFAAERERGDAASRHGRELARFELEVRGNPAQALADARANLGIQKEPIDLLIMAQTAVAAGDLDALDNLRRLLARQGLVDARINRVLKQARS